MKMNYSDMFDCISDKSAEILNEYEEYELDTVFSAVNTFGKKEKSGNGEYYLQRQ